MKKEQTPIYRAAFYRILSGLASVPMAAGARSRLAARATRLLLAGKRGQANAVIFAAVARNAKPARPGPAVLPDSLLLRRLHGGAAPEPAGDFERALLAGHRGNLVKMRAGLAGFCAAPRPAAVPANIFRALMELGRYREAFEAGEDLMRRSGGTCDLLVLKEPFIDARFAPGRGYWLGHIRGLSALKCSGRAAGWKHYYLGLAHRRLEQNEKALAHFDEAARLGPRYGWMRFWRGHTLLNLRADLKAAAGDLAAAVRANRKDWVSMCLLGETLVCRGRGPRGFSWFARALREHRGNRSNAAAIRAWRGLMALYCGAYGKALADLRRAKKDGGVFAYGWLGAALVCSGRLREALKELAAAARLLPGDRETRLWLAEAQRLSGDRRRARKNLSSCAPGVWTLANAGLLSCGAGDGGAARAWRRLDPAIRQYLLEETGADPGTGEGLKALFRKLLEKGRGNRNEKKYLLTLWLPKEFFNRLIND